MYTPNYRIFNYFDVYRKYANEPIEELTIDLPENILFLKVLSRCCIAVQAIHSEVCSGTETKQCRVHQTP
mgnify:CR=1 FL=1